MVSCMTTFWSGFLLRGIANAVFEEQPPPQRLGRGRSRFIGKGPELHVNRQACTGFENLIQKFARSGSQHNPE